MPTHEAAETSETTRAKALVREYFVRLDIGRADLLDLFTDDAQFYFPKFGVRSGKAAFGDLISGLLTHLSAISHDIENLKFVVEGNTVAVEGTTKGALKDGTEWRGGHTPGGRFASIFQITGERISRMHVYLDPDYGGQHKALFLWPKSSPGW
jgi:ketosteroid isomerase-like protein